MRTMPQWCAPDSVTSMARTAHFVSPTGLVTSTCESRGGTAAAQRWRSGHGVGWPEVDVRRVRHHHLGGCRHALGVEIDELLEHHERGSGQEADDDQDLEDGPTLRHDRAGPGSSARRRRWWPGSTLRQPTGHVRNRRRHRPSRPPAPGREDRRPHSSWAAVRPPGSPRPGTRRKRSGRQAARPGTTARPRHWREPTRTSIREGAHEA